MLLAFLPLLVSVAWRRRLAWSAACLVAAVGVLGLWAIHNAVRYDEPTVARGGRAWVPFLRVFLADRTIAPENGDASRRLADLIEDEVLASEPHAALDVPLDAYLRHGSNYETVRLIALSDRVYGRDENYDVLFDSALEAIREHPGTYARGVADAFWEFLRQAPLREDVVRREQTAPEAPPPTFEADGVVFPNPQAHVLVEGVPYGFVWCASDYIDSCTLDDLARLDRRRTAAPLRRDRPPGAGMGCRAAGARRGRRRHRAPEPRDASLPRPPFWLALGLVGLAFRRPRDWRVIVTLWIVAALVLLIHAASPGSHARVRAPALPGVHRDCARRARRGVACE